MDIQMPVMDGLEATRIIRNELKSDLPIIAVTGATEFDEAMCKEAGVNDYMNKPVALPVLTEKIELNARKS